MWGLSIQIYFAGSIQESHWFGFGPIYKCMRIDIAHMVGGLQTFVTMIMRLFVSYGWPLLFRIVFWVVFVIKTLLAKKYWVVMNLSDSSSKDESVKLFPLLPEKKCACQNGNSHLFCLFSFSERTFFNSKNSSYYIDYSSKQ